MMINSHQPSDQWWTIYRGRSFQPRCRSDMFQIFQTNQFVTFFLFSIMCNTSDDVSLFIGGLLVSRYLLAAFFHSILNSLSLLFFILFLVTVKKASQLLKKAPSNLCESIISYHRKTSGKIFRIINKWRENVLAIYVLSVDW